jgi:hypothetical protein
LGSYSELVAFHAQNLDLRVGLVPEHEQARLTQSRRLPDLVLREARSSSAAAENRRQLRHHLAPRRLLDLAAQVLRPLDQHLRLRRIARIVSSIVISASRPYRRHSRVDSFSDERGDVSASSSISAAW